jgi:hypothetical protein
MENIMKTEFDKLQNFAYNADLQSLAMGLEAAQRAVNALEEKAGTPKPTSEPKKAPVRRKK